MASRARTRLTLDELLSGVFNDDFGLSDSESSEEEGEDVHTSSGKHNLACGEVVALSKAVSSEPLKIITTLVNLVLYLLFLQLVMTVVVRMMMRKRPWSVLVSRAHCIYKKIVCLLVPVFYPGSFWALVGCFPQAIVNVICLCLQVLLLHLKALVTVRVI